MKDVKPPNLESRQDFPSQKSFNKPSGESRSGISVRLRAIAERTSEQIIRTCALTGSGSVWNLPRLHRFVVLKFGFSKWCKGLILVCISPLPSEVNPQHIEPCYLDAHQPKSEEICATLVPISEPFILYLLLQLPEPVISRDCPKLRTWRNYVLRLVLLPRWSGKVRILQKVYNVVIMCLGILHGPVKNLDTGTPIVM